MSLWEYKVITSGKGGFATPVLLEKFLNDLGRDEWEIVSFQTQPDNFLAFTGLARRPTQRDWTLEDAAAAAAKAEAEKLRAEFEAKFKAASVTAPAEERASDFLHDKVAPEDGFRKPVDTSHDDDPDADDEKDDWDKLTAAEEDELPTFFEAMKPHMRRNQRGPGMSVGVDYLAKKWDQTEEDIKGALAECGFVLPEDEDAKAEYLEYDGDLYWVNVNRRGELWINTKEKPRAVFRTVKAQKITLEEEPKPEPRRNEERAPKQSEEAEKTGTADQPSEGAAMNDEAGGEPAGEPSDASSDRSEGSAEAAAGESKPERQSGGRGGSLPEGPALLRKIRPHMRRNRRGPGGSGSTSFLSRAMKCNEADLRVAFATLGLKVPGSAAEKPTYVEIGNEVWWLNADSRGGLWINGRDKRPGEVVGAASAEAEPSGAPTEQPQGADTPAADSSGANADTETETPGAPSAEATAGQPAPSESPSPTATPSETESTRLSTAEAGASKAASDDTAPAENTAATEATPQGPGEPTITEAVAVPEPQPLHPAEALPVTDAAAPVAPVLTDAVPVPGVTESVPSAETSPAAAPAGSAAAVNASPAPVNENPVLAAVRPLLKESKGGGVSAKLEVISGELGQSVEDLIAALIAAGLKVPEKPREKPVLVEFNGEALWLSRNARGELWCNGKPSKLAGEPDGEEEPAADEPPADEADPDAEKKRRTRPKKKAEAE
jgi:hypothetical protein